MQLTKFTHACVRLDDGDRSLTIDPGAFSAPMFLEATGSYHCTIHPVMVGTIKGQ